jgi:FlaA1/EpsC-like NDP-sugar epimerase
MLGPPSSDWGRFLPQPQAEEPIQAPDAHAGQCVVITGAGGYIGSALARAVTGASPDRLVLLDTSEQNLFEIHSQLNSRDVPHETILGSIGDLRLLDRLFDRVRPDIVYHAAAFKHVPLLELNPFAAVQNNAVGTFRLALRAIAHRVPRLVLISTDKAVNPHSVMGVSKRIAELATLALSNSACRMSAVRLVNVIGSTGTVVPEFLRQINQRRPVKVTHRDAQRWFLTLRETIHAILACGASPEGDLFVPCVGEPVNIACLAEYLIRMNPGAETQILYTGLRPGDKLREELLSCDESVARFDGVLGLVKSSRPKTAPLMRILEDLAECVADGVLGTLVDTLRAAVPEYVPSTLILNASKVIG